MSPFVRTVKTGSGATAVQIVWSKHRGRRELEHVGSAGDPVGVAALRQEADRRIHRGEEQLPLVAAGGDSVVFPVVASRAQRLLGALRAAWETLGFDQAVGDEVFYQLVVARVVEPSSKLDALRVLAGLGLETVSYSTVKRHLVRCVSDGYQARLEAACAAHARVEEVRFCLYDVTTLYFETHQGDGFREPGYSKERRLEPQITVGLLTTADGFPLKVSAFEGDKGETKTILPVLEQFRRANPAARVTVVADAGMMSWDNLAALEDAGFDFVVGGRIPEEPWCVKQWRAAHPGRDIPDQQVFHQAKSLTRRGKPRQWHAWFQYRAARAARDLAGIDKTLAKARSMADGAPMAKNRFLTIEGETRRVNQGLVEDARARAGLRCYVTNLAADPQPVIDAYHQLWHVEEAFRMSKHDLEARPVYHWKRPSIEAHLTIVFAALAISHWIRAATGLTLRRFLEATRPIRTHTIAINGHQITAEDAISPTAAAALEAIHAQALSRGH
jgi:hypothetical protein